MSCTKEAIIAGEDEMRKRIQESFSDPRPSIPAEVVFKRLRARNARMRKKLARQKKAGFPPSRE